MNVVVTLVSQLLFQGFRIIMNNYYFSIRTFRYLHNIKHNVIGIMQLKQITFELVMKKSTFRGTMKWRITIKIDDEDEKHTFILSYAWKDSEVVYFICRHVIKEEIPLW
jgi:hypothetical protein